MPFAAAHSFHPQAAAAVAECVGQLLEAQGPHPDLLLVLATNEHRRSWAEIGRAARALLRPACQVGVVTTSLIAGPRVVSRQPALSLWAAWGLEVGGAVTLGGSDPAGAGAEDGEGADAADRSWARAGGVALDELITASGPAPALLVLANPETGVERLVMELAMRHRELPTAGAVLAAPRTRRSRQPSVALAAAPSALQLDGEAVLERVVVVVLRSGDLLTSRGERDAGAMEVATSADPWPPGGPAPEPEPSARPGGATDDVAGDLVLDILQRRAQAALVFDSGQGEELAGDLTDLTDTQLPMAGLNGVRVIGPVVSLGFNRRSAIPGRPDSPAMPVVPAIAVALFRDRSDTI